MNFIKDITHREGKGSGRKFWFNIACCTATAVLLWVTARDTMEDEYLICLYSVYLVTVGGFEVIPKMLSMIIDLKNGGRHVGVTDSKQKDNS